MNIASIRSPLWRRSAIIVLLPVAIVAHAAHGVALGWRDMITDIRSAWSGPAT